MKVRVRKFFVSPTRAQVYVEHGSEPVLITTIELPADRKLTRKDLKRIIAEQLKEQQKAIGRFHILSELQTSREELDIPGI